MRFRDALALVLVAATSAGGATSNAAAQDTAPASPVLEFTVPAAGLTPTLWVNLKSRPDTGDVVRTTAEGINAKIVGTDPTHSRTQVTLLIPSAPSALGPVAVEILGPDGTLKGTQSLRLRWPKLATPSSITVRRQDGSTPAGPGLVLPTSASGAPVTYSVELSLRAAEFLTSDRLWFNDTRIKVEDEQPSGPSVGTPSPTASFRVTVDPANPPDLGASTFEIRNPNREQRTATQLSVISESQPSIVVVDPVAVAPGAATVTIKGDGFDPNPALLVTGTMGGNQRRLDWKVTRESRGVLQATGIVDPGLQSLRFVVQNPNGRQSGALTVGVNNAVRSLTVRELTDKGGAIYPGEQATLTLDLATDAAFPAPRSGDGHGYEVLIESSRLTPTILAEGWLQVQLTYPPPTDVRASATEISRPIRVLRDGLLTWQADQGLIVQLPVIVTEPATILSPPLLPGAERQVIVRGKHFREKDVEVVPGPGLEVKQGTKEVTASTVKFVAVASATSVPAAPVKISLLQDGKTFDGGVLPVTPMPHIATVVSVRADDRAMQAGRTNEVKTDGRIFVDFDGTKLTSVGQTTYTVKAVRDTIGEPVVLAARDVPVAVGAAVHFPVAQMEVAGLQPGQSIRVEVSQKDRPEQAVTVLGRIRRTGAAHVGLLLGAAAARLELGGAERTGKRHATLSDVHFGAEYIVSNYSADLGVGAGLTLLGAPKAATSNATVGVAFTPTVRFRALTLMLGKQLTTSPEPVEAAEGTATSGSGTTQSVVAVRAFSSAADATEPPKKRARPLYLMLGLSFGTDVSSVLTRLGGG